MNNRKFISLIYASLSFLLFFICTQTINLSGISNSISQEYLIINWYALSRVILVPYVFVICVYTGSLFTKSIIDNYNNIIVDYCIGFIFLSLLGMFFGFLGLIEPLIAKFIFYPLAAIAGPLVIIRCISLLKNTDLNQGYLFPLAGLLILFGLVSIILKAAFIANVEADVWEIYIPYYREVLSSGSLLPGIVWPQFFASKSAGLIHLVNAISDEFSSSIVGWSNYFIGLLIFMSVLGRGKNKILWAIFGGSVYLIAGTCDYSIGAFSRHHTTTLMLIAYILWINIRVIAYDEILNKKVEYTSYLLTFYMGLFLLPLTPLILGYFCILILYCFYSKIKYAIILLVKFSISIILGSISELIINHYFTGLASVFSANFFWNFANKDKFYNTIGESGIQFFLETNNSNSNQINFLWVLDLLRFKDYLSIYLIAILAILYFIAFKINYVKVYIKKNDCKALLLISLFFLMSILIAFIVNNESMKRLYFYLNFVEVLLVILFIKILIQATDYKFISIRNLSVTFICILLSIAALFLFNSGAIKNIITSFEYLLGRVTLYNGLNISSAFHKKSNQLEFIQEVRKIIGYNERILTLTYSPGPAYAIPGIGLMSEPTYSLGPHYREILTGSVEVARERIKELGIKYFYIDLQSNFFSSLISTELFNAESLKQNFIIAFEYNDQMLLRFRDVDEAININDQVINAVQLKQLQAQHYFFDNDFAINIYKIVHQDGSALVKSENINKFIKDRLDQQILTHGNRVYINDMKTKINFNLKSSHLLSNNSLDDIKGLDIETENIIKKIQETVYMHCKDTYSNILCIQLNSENLYPFNKIYLNVINNKYK